MYNTLWNILSHLWKHFEGEDEHSPVANYQYTLGNTPYNSSGNHYECVMVNASTFYITVIRNFQRNITPKGQLFDACILLYSMELIVLLCG